MLKLVDWMLEREDRYEAEEESRRLGLRLVQPGWEKRTGLFADARPEGSGAAVSPLPFNVAYERRSHPRHAEEESEFNPLASNIG